MSSTAKFYHPISNATVLNAKRKSREASMFRNDLRNILDETNFEIDYNVKNRAYTPSWSNSKTSKTKITVEFPEDEKDRYQFMYKNAKQFTRIAQKSRALALDSTHAFKIPLSKNLGLYQDSVILDNTLKSFRNKYVENSDQISSNTEIHEIENSYNDQNESLPSSPSMSSVSN